MRKLIILGVIAAALTTAACNTVAGGFQIAADAGQAVTSSSNSARN
jgi:entericidin B